MNNNRNYLMLIELLMIYVLYYIVFFFIFFFILGSNSVELVIGFSFIFLLILVYIYFSDFIENYFIVIYKNIWLHFSNLLILIKLCKDIVLSINNTYLMFMEYKIYVLYNITNTIDLNFNNIIVDLSEKFFINNSYKLILNKLILLDNSSKILNNIFVLSFNNSDINLMNIKTMYIYLNKL